MRQAAHTPWLFVGPNLVIFGAFTFLPIVINVYYAFTGGVELYPRDRPFVGFENLATLLDCGNYLDPSSCKKDIFWRAVWNTAKFSVFQVSLMVLFSMITALVLNRKIIGRGFWRGVYFYPVLLSPVVVALIWKWILQREGLLNAGMVAVGANPVLWLAEPGWAFFWVIFVSIWAHMGFYTLILLAGLQASRPTCMKPRRWTAPRRGARCRASRCRCCCRTCWWCWCWRRSARCRPSMKSSC